MDWFRFYSDVVHDPKVQKLSPTMFKHWVNVICLASANDPRGLVPPPSDVGFALRISEGRATVLLEELLALVLLDADEEGNLSPHNWSRRQFDSDDVTSRVRRFRDKRNVARNVTEPLHETPPEQNRTETDPETEQSRPRSDAVDCLAADFAQFGKVTAGTAQAIEYAIKDYTLEWVQLAVRKAAASGAEDKPPWSYVESILERWKEQGHPDEPQPTRQRKQLQTASHASRVAGNDDPRWAEMAKQFPG